MVQAIFLSLVKISKIYSVSTYEKLGNLERDQQDFGLTGRFKERKSLIEEESEDEYEEDNDIDQLLLNIQESLDEQIKALDLQVKKHYTQLDKEKFFHLTFEELKRNKVTSLDKCLHANNH